MLASQRTRGQTGRYGHTIHRLQTMSCQGRPQCSCVPAASSALTRSSHRPIGILAQELGIRRLIIDNRLGEDLNAADRCWGAAGMAIGEYSYMSTEEAAKWALVDESGAGGGLVHVTWRRDAHPVLTQPDDVHARVRLLPRVCAEALTLTLLPRVCAEALRVCRGSALTLLVVTHGDVINHFAPAFDWSPDVGRYRAEPRMSADGSSATTSSHLRAMKK